MQPRSDRGFTLIEIVITIFVIGVTAVLFSSAIDTLTFTRDVRFEDLALRIATQQIETMRASGYSSVASGTFTNALLASLPSGSASSTVSTFNAKTKKVLVQVGWQQTDRPPRTITLVTLVTQTGGL